VNRTTLLTLRKIHCRPMYIDVGHMAVPLVLEWISVDSVGWNSIFVSTLFFLCTNVLQRHIEGYNAWGSCSQIKPCLILCRLPIKPTRHPNGVSETTKKTSQGRISYSTYTTSGADMPKSGVGPAHFRLRSRLLSTRIFFLIHPPQPYQARVPIVYTLLQ
jgi:hypothetical protein